jgi:hypothetical protein
MQLGFLGFATSFLYVLVHVLVLVFLEFRTRRYLHSTYRYQIPGTVSAHSLPCAEERDANLRMVLPGTTVQDKL